MTGFLFIYFSILAPFSCLVCDFKFISTRAAIIHIEDYHPDWEKKEGKFENVGVLFTFSVLGEINVPKKSGNVHKNNQWLSLLTSSFQVHQTVLQTEILYKRFNCLQVSVIENCSKSARDAARNNEDIENHGERRAVFNEIVNQTVTHLETYFGSETPSKYIYDLDLKLFKTIFFCLQESTRLFKLLVFLPPLTLHCSKTMAPFLLLALSILDMALVD